MSTNPFDLFNATLDDSILAVERLSNAIAKLKAERHFQPFCFTPTAPPEEEEEYKVFIPSAPPAEEEKELSSEDSCAICLDTILHDSVWLPCIHQFHEQCVKRWLQDHHTCPVCRHQT